MATILISYDVHNPRSKAHEELTETIQSLGTWWHHLETTWILKCEHTVMHVRDQLQPHVAFDDQLLVIDISGDQAEWFGINETGSQWLRDNI